MAFTDIIYFLPDIEGEKRARKRQIFAEVRSIGMKETYEAHARGLKPELTFVIVDYLDYRDEEFIEFNGKIYKVFRTYRKSEDNQLEIVVQHVLNNSGVYTNGYA